MGSLSEDCTYPVPAGVHIIPDELLDLRPDDEIDQELQQLRPVAGVKNVWFFWHSGFQSMHPYAQRNVRAWHRRFSKQGWVVRVMNRVPGDALNIANFIDINDPGTVPQAFTDDTISGTYAKQHTSDLVRWPLLLRHGGVYADAGMMQIGDMDRLWNETIGNPQSPIEVIGYNCDVDTIYDLANYCMCCGPGNALFERCHRLLLKLWEGRTSTDGLHKSPLLVDVPPMKESNNLSFEEDGKVYGPVEVHAMLSDYIIQGHAMRLVAGLVDDENGWDGPAYMSEHVYAIEYMVHSQLINQLTAWNGPRQFELMSLPLPKDGEPESDDQKEARNIVEQCLGTSFGFKLAHGLIIRVLGSTLGSLWREHEGADVVPHTYAHWLRHGIAYWDQDNLPPRQMLKKIKPYKRGRLLEGPPSD